MSDKNIGYTLILVTIIATVVYFVWSFASFLGPLFSWITPEMSEWAFKIPVIFAVYAILLILLWIGYTLATAEELMPLENPLK
jgi:hypothetical protein